MRWCCLLILSCLRQRVCSWTRCDRGCLTVRWCSAHSHCRWSGNRNCHSLPCSATDCWAPERCGSRCCTGKGSNIKSERLTRIFFSFPPTLPFCLHISFWCSTAILPFLAFHCLHWTNYKKFKTMLLGLSPANKNQTTLFPFWKNYTGSLLMPVSTTKLPH